MAAHITTPNFVARTLQAQRTIPMVTPLAIVTILGVLLDTSMAGVND